MTATPIRPTDEVMASEYRVECPDCEGEGLCETCDATGYIWTSEPCTLADAPIGMFRDAETGTLALKTEYGSNEGRIDAYIVSSGEFYWGAAPQTIASQRAQIVHPLDEHYVEAALTSRDSPEAVRPMQEACAKVAEDEQVDAEDTREETDRAYNAACTDIATAIRAMPLPDRVG